MSRSIIVLLLAVAACPAQACEPSGRPQLEISVEPGELASADRVLRIVLHDNGCALVHLPAHDRRAGDHRVQAEPARHAGLLATAAELRRGGVDSKRLRAEIDAARSKRGDDGQPGKVFAVLDADRYHLVLHGPQPLELRVEALPQYAQRHKQAAGLQSTHALAEALLDLSRDIPAPAPAGARP